MELENVLNNENQRCKNFAKLIQVQNNTPLQVEVLLFFSALVVESWSSQVQLLWLNYQITSFVWLTIFTKMYNRNYKLQPLNVIRSKKTVKVLH